MAISANTLFHFTKDKKNLISILQNFFYPKYSLEDFSNIMPDGQVYAARIPMVCFCDIVFSQIHDHIKFYGNYGIGLSKKTWGLAKGISPILYVPKDSISSKLITTVDNKKKSLYKSRNRLSHEQLPEFCKYIKPYQGWVMNRETNSTEERIFYHEREWRYVPKGFPVLSENSAAEAEGANDKMKNTKKLSFKAKDIKYIIVKNEKEIPEFVDIIEKKLNNYFNEIERKQLVSRLISVQQINDDM